MQLAQKYGQNIMLANVPVQEWQAIADMGMDVVWLMGVWSLGAYGLNHDRTDPSLLAGYASVLPGYTTVGVEGCEWKAVWVVCLRPCDC